MILIIFINQESIAQEANSCENGRIQHWDKIVFEIIDDRNDPMIIPVDYMNSKLDIRIVASGGIVNADSYIKQSLQEQFGLNATQSDNVEILVDDILYDVITCTPDPEKNMWAFLEHPFFLLIVGGVFTGILIPWFHRWNETKLKNIEAKKQKNQKSLDIKEKLISKISESVTMMDMGTHKTLVSSDLNSSLTENVDFQEFGRNMSIIRTQIKAYFESTEIPKKFSIFSNQMIVFWNVVFELTKKDKDYEIFEEYKKYFKDENFEAESMSQEEKMEFWSQNTRILIGTCDDVIKKILETPITAFETLEK